MNKLLIAVIIFLGCAVIVGIIYKRTPNPICIGLNGGLTCEHTSQAGKMEYNKLTPEEEKIIIHKGTERPFTGKYNNFSEKGTYICRRCNAPLYSSKDKFHSDCGWPSFDNEISGAVKRVPDKDGLRTEIICANCGAHLGHVFTGEGLTKKNVRHCVNSLSMDFIPAGGVLLPVISFKQKEEPKKDVAYFAGGCFWGVEYYFLKAKGVVSTRVGYMGGRTKNPTYEEVSTGTTGHAETMEVVYDSSKTSYEDMAKLFFEIHDPDQVNRQGPDVGPQYRSEIFYVNDEQKKIAEKLIKILKAKGYAVATKVEKAGIFYEAEKYHQSYYQKNGKLPYCHIYKKKF